jgi:hypothetical protein
MANKTDPIGGPKLIDNKEICLFVGGMNLYLNNCLYVEENITFRELFSKLDELVNKNNIIEENDLFDTNKMKLKTTQEVKLEATEILIIGKIIKKLNNNHLDMYLQNFNICDETTITVYFNAVKLL